MSSQITNNNYMTTFTSLNPYITRKLNNIDEAKVFKNKQDYSDHPHITNHFDLEKNKILSFGKK